MSDIKPSLEKLYPNKKLGSTYGLLGKGAGKWRYLSQLFEIDMLRSPVFCERERAIRLEVRASPLAGDERLVYLVRVYGRSGSACWVGRCGYMENDIRRWAGMRWIQVGCLFFLNTGREGVELVGMSSK